MKFLIYAFLYLSTVKALEVKTWDRMPRIGIIGGGIGGTSCAFFLKALFSKSNVTIDLFEANRIGGRLSSANFSNNLYEEGGSIIHSSNKYMSEFLKQFKLEKRQTSKGYFGLYDGKDFVFSESEWQIRTLWNVVHRYGFGFWKLKSFVDDMITKFERIYELQDIGMAYSTVGSMLAALDPKFTDYLRMTSKFGFESQGIPKIVVDEIIMATVRANYGQNLNIHTMVGSVSVAGAVGDLWSVHGGNMEIPKNLLEASEANFFNLPVSSVRRLPSGQMEIVTLGTTRDDPEASRDGTNRIYDAVIVATPQTPDSKYKIDFSDFGKEIKFLGEYHKTVCTLIEGKLSDKYFPNKYPVIDEILTINESVFFNSIGRITPVDYVPEKLDESNVWKIFTQNKMDDKKIFSLFSEVKNKYVREWLAYPHYGSSFRNDSFVLADNLYHINAIEWAASAMEMSVIGAKNVALLTYKNLLTGKQPSPRVEIGRQTPSFMVLLAGDSGESVAHLPPKVVSFLNGISLGEQLKLLHPRPNYSLCNMFLVKRRCCLNSWSSFADWPIVHN